MRNPSRWAAAAAMALTAVAGAHAADVQVAKDPATGQLRAPTAAEAKALTAKAASSTGRRGLVTGTLNPQPQRHANGMKSLELTEDTMSYSVAQKNPDGTVSFVCVTGEKAANQALKAAPKTLPQQHAHAEKGDAL